MSKQIYKSTALVGAVTLLSRILGFVRDMVIAMFFGADSGTDAFFVAFKIPNFLRRLFAEGAFSQAFVPVVAEYEQKSGRAVLKDFIDRTSGTLAVLLAALSLVGVLAAPVLIVLFAPGFHWGGERHQLAVEMLRITFPYLFFITATAFAGGILNAMGRYAVPAFTPAVLNLCMIAAAIWLAPLMDRPVMALAWGVFLAGVAQLTFQLPSLFRLGLVPRPRLGFKDARVRKVIKLMVPAIFSVSVTQINLLVDTLVATFLAAGSVSWLYYSDRLVEFPVGVFGLALATVILPHLSTNHAGDDRVAFSRSLDWGLRLVLLVGIPGTLGLLLLAEPILSTLFQYNAFTSSDVEMAGRSLMAYAVGLTGFIVVKILVPGFTARQDMTTPTRYGVYSVLANGVLNVLLVFHLAHAGLALATSLAAFLNAGLLLRKLLRDRIYVPEPGWLGFLARLLAANLTMGLALHFWVDPSDWIGWDAGARAAHLSVWIVLGAVVYAATLRLTGLRTKHLSLEAS